MTELIGICGQIEWATIGINKELKLKFHEAVKKKHGFARGAIGFEMTEAIEAHIKKMKSDSKEQDEKGDII